MRGKKEIEMLENLKGLNESQRRSKLMAGVWLTPGQQLGQAAFGGMDEVNEAIGDDGRDLAGVAQPARHVRKGPNSVERTLGRWTGQPALTFVCGPTHVEETDEGVDANTPEAILIAAEAGDDEDAVCALGNDPLKNGIPTLPAPAQRRRIIDRSAVVLRAA